MDDWNPEVRVFKMKAIVRLRYSFWRHPILWWKTRHLLPDMQEAERRQKELLSPEFYETFLERLEEELLYGTGEREGP